MKIEKSGRVAGKKAMRDRHLTPEASFCSFCGTTKHGSLAMVGGPGVAICSTCVAEAASVMESENGGNGLRPKPWETMDDSQLLNHLPEVSAVKDQVELSLAAWVAIARERKISWDRIGRALGITRQSAWERFRNATSPSRSTSS